MKALRSPIKCLAAGAAGLVTSLTGCGVPPAPNLSVLPSPEEKATPQAMNVGVDVNIETIPSGLEKVGNDLYDILSGRTHHSMKPAPSFERGPAWSLFDEKFKEKEKQLRKEASPKPPAPVPAQRPPEREGR